MIGSVGPKVSSVMHLHRVVDVDEHGRLVEAPAALRQRLAAGEHARALVDGVGDVVLDRLAAAAGT